MTGIGTIVNTIAVIAGGIIGLFIKGGLPQRFKNIIMEAIGLSVLIIGSSGALQGIYKVIEGERLDRQFIMTMIFSLVIGGIIGELLGIEAGLEKMGLWLQNKFAKSEGNFAAGFINASLIFCVGAMAIVGSLEDGLTGNPGTLFAKSILDGISSVVFAATLGAGVVFSAFSVLIYQGVITLLSGLIKPLLTDVVITQMSLVGSVLILGIGISMLGIKKIKVGNMLPAIFIPFVYYLISRL